MKLLDTATKVVVGSAAGVGVMVALPFLAPVGAVTALGAAIGIGTGVAGGLLAAYLDDDQDARSASREDRAEQKAAEYAERLRASQQANSAWEKYARASLVVCAVGYGAAATNGAVGEAVRHEVRELFFGLSWEELPQFIAEVIEEWAEHPPGFATAVDLYLHVDPTRSDTKLREAIEIMLTSLLTVDEVHPGTVCGWLFAWRCRTASVQIPHAVAVEAA